MNMMLQGKSYGCGCTCGCCAGIQLVTPQPIANPPGLNALTYRVGTHATFLETMLARLSSKDYPGLAALKNLERLTLRFSRVSDVGLKDLTGLKQLHALHHPRG